MVRQFVYLPTFDSQLKELDLDIDDTRFIEAILLSNPSLGRVVTGTGGVRKCRIPLHNNKGKSGGARVVYVDFVFAEKIYMLGIFSKNMKDNLSRSERNQLKSLVHKLESELRKGDKLERVFREHQKKLRGSN